MNVEKALPANDSEIVLSILQSACRPENVIEAKYVVKNYGGFTAVNAVSFDVRRGEVFALLGPNGAGKTTIVEILECLKTPTNGFVNILGNAVLTGIPAGNLFAGMGRDYRAIKEKIGVLPQHFSAFNLLTVRENLDYYARMFSRHADVDGLLREFSLEDRRNVQFRHLSAGLKQRVGMAIALVNDPEIVFLDEPTAGLDPLSRREVWAAVKALKARGKTVFLTTHYMDEAYFLADRVCFINRGSLIAEGSPDDLIDRYGGGNTLVVRACSGAAQAALTAAIPGSRAVGNDVLVQLPEDAGMESLARAVYVIEAGHLDCGELYVKKPTLEDVFLRLTGEMLGEGGQ